MNNWLEANLRSSRSKFNVIDITEKKSQPSQIVLDNLAKEVLLHFVDDRWLKKAFGEKDKKLLEAFLQNELFPDSAAHSNPRQSMFGEIFTGVVARELKNAIIPLRKLRYKECKDKAMRGKADVVLANLINDRLVIIFCETKTKVAYKKSTAKKLNDKGLAEEAYNGLKHNNVNKPEIVSYLAQKMYYDDEYGLADLFDEAVIDPKSYDKKFEIYLIFQKEFWNEETLDHLESIGVSLPNLEVNVVLINDLKELIETSYKLSLDKGKGIVYG